MYMNEKARQGLGEQGGPQQEYAKNTFNIPAPNFTVNRQVTNQVQDIVTALGGHFLDDGSALVHCPAHNDRTPSLHITKASDRRFLAHCMAGCSQEVVVQALKDLGYGQGERKTGLRTISPEGCR